MIKKTIMVVNKALTKLRYHIFIFIFLAEQVPQARPCRNPVGPRYQPYLNDVIAHSSFLSSDLQRNILPVQIDTKCCFLFYMSTIL